MVMSFKQHLIKDRLTKRKVVHINGIVDRIKVVFLMAGSNKVNLKKVMYQKAMENSLTFTDLTYIFSF